MRLFYQIWTLVLLLLPSFVNACVVLLYHHFDTNTPKITSISPALFEQHLSYIKENNFQVLSVKELIQKLKTKTTLPNKCVVLTADDAYISIMKNALPLLIKYNMPMSVFVATDGVHKKYKALMTYQQMRSIDNKYLTFYNHSVKHEHFYNFNKQQAKDNINQAQTSLKRELKVVDKIFAYPYGEYNLKSYNAIKELGFVAFGQHSGAIDLTSDLYALPRFPMSGDYAKMKNFIIKINTLSMPIVENTPISQITKDNPPTLKLILQNKLDMNCYVSGQELADIVWQDKTAFITARKPLKPGRTKYNCTAKSSQKDRFYWLSKQWLVLD